MMSANASEVTKSVLFDDSIASTENDYFIADLSQAAYGRK